MTYPHRNALRLRLGILCQGMMFVIIGCGPSDVGTIDLSKSKAVAAEKGLDAEKAARGKGKFKTEVPKREEGKPTARGISR